MTRMRFFVSIYTLAIIFSSNISALNIWQQRSSGNSFSKLRSVNNIVYGLPFDDSVSPSGVAELPFEVSTSPVTDDGLVLSPVSLPEVLVPALHVVRSVPASPVRGGRPVSSLPPTPERPFDSFAFVIGVDAEQMSGRSCGIFGLGDDRDDLPMGADDSSYCQNIPDERIDGLLWRKFAVMALELRKACGAIETAAALNGFRFDFPVTMELIHFFACYEQLLDQVTLAPAEHCSFFQTMIEFDSWFKGICEKVAELSVKVLSTDEACAAYKDCFSSQSERFSFQMNKVFESIHGIKRANPVNGAVLGNPAMLS